MPPFIPLEKRFWEKVQKGSPDECWEWTGNRGRRGYGHIRLPGAGNGSMVAHRQSWVFANGPIPDGLFVLHHCDNPPCCNPSHLFLGTQTDNMRDRSAKLRGPYGEKSYNAVLTDDKVREIRRRRAAGETFSSIAYCLEVEEQVVRMASLGYTWKHVDEPLPPRLHKSKTFDLHL